MEITTRDLGQVRVLTLAGRLGSGGGAATLRAVVDQGLAGNRTRLLLDLWQVTLVDSTGLGMLVSCLTSTRNRGGDLKLLRPSPKVADVLTITATDNLFRIYRDQDEAVQSFAEPTS